MGIGVALLTHSDNGIMHGRSYLISNCAIDGMRTVCVCVCLC